ncbi:MAG: hypothetical protein A3G41_05705 [Elusimicrobia bacterium RIFCSPLOWO2_12_FULL_59_9]|nr:MAG: hypothetical protein A3G41_05705 [Elusimicrobia bacterium RIFCSPLOWO2_12_FULL_59_9]
MKRTPEKKHTLPNHQKRHWVRLTRDCNLRCVFCLDKDAQDGTNIPFPAVVDDLQRGRDRGVVRVVLSGGEPTIHPDYLRIVSRAREMEYTHIQTVTNGKMFCYKNFLDQAVTGGLTEITFSIHGHTAQLHDSQVKMPGSFVQAMAGLTSALKIPGLIVSVDIVLSRLNVKHLPEMLEFFVGVGVREFDLLQVIPFGLAWQNNSGLFYDIEENLPYLRKAFEYSKRPDISLWTNRFPPKYLEGFENLIQYPGKLRDEVLGEAKDMFEAYLRQGKLMLCHGDRCRFCYNDELCQDFVRFKETGRLEAKKIPPCLEDWEVYADSENEPRPVLEMPGDPSKADPAKVVNFFIPYRYYLKSSQCARCRCNDSCAGAPVDHIRQYGFNSLKPIE